MNELKQLREQLDSLTSEILQLFCKRKELIGQIYTIKSKDNLTAWDPVREFDIFIKFKKNLEVLTLEELLALSLLIESHAFLNDQSYPRWSQTVHIDFETPAFDLSFLVNPILLYCAAPSYFVKIPIKAQFLSKIEDKSLNKS